MSRQRVWYPPAGPTGMTIRPPIANCSISGGGTSVGDAVTVAGLRLGQVGAISLESDGRVKTKLLIEEGVVLTQDCSVEIRGVGLVDEKYIHSIKYSICRQAWRDK